jgi:TonB family protein
MPNTLFRVAVALLTFGLGVSATTLWLAYSTPEVKLQKSKPAKKKECMVGQMLPLPDAPPLPSLDEPPPPPKPLLPSHAPISGGILNGKASSMPQPAYPSIARKARASGTVNVQVTVDENGDVISAKAIGGHPLLQQAAVDAAYQARFAPTRLSGQFVKVSGVLNYNFVRQ